VLPEKILLPIAVKPHIVHEAVQALRDQFWIGTRCLGTLQCSDRLQDLSVVFIELPRLPR
jgi:hypothetical protein